MLIYSAEVCGLYKATYVQRVHRTFIKSLLGVRISIHNMTVYCESGPFPLYISRDERIIIYWFTLLYCGNEILRETYENMLYECTNKGVKLGISGERLKV